MTNYELTRQELFDYMMQEFNVSLLQSQMTDIFIICNKLIEAKASQGEWISLNSRLPDCSDKRVRILVCWKKTNAVFTLWYGTPFGSPSPIFYEENEWNEDDNGEIDEDANTYLGAIQTYKDITHWMPLPAAPKV